MKKSLRPSLGINPKKKKKQNGSRLDHDTAVERPPESVDESGGCGGGGRKKMTEAVSQLTRDFRCSLGMNSQKKKQTGSRLDHDTAVAERPPDSVVDSGGGRRKKMTPDEAVFKLTRDMPVDASDVINLQVARDEIQLLRHFAKDYLTRHGVDASTLHGLDEYEAPSETEPMEVWQPSEVDRVTSQFDDMDMDEEDEMDQSISSMDYIKNSVRRAMYERQDYSSFRKVEYAKSAKIRSLIYDTIKANMLFENENDAELAEMIDVFTPETFGTNERVVVQGEEATKFYVVESGKLSLDVETSDGAVVNVGTFGQGDSFGELALILDSPQEGSVTAKSEVKLWVLQRDTYRALIGRLRQEEHRQKKDFLMSCEVSGGKFAYNYKAWQLEDMATAAKTDSFKKGEVILRQGEMCDRFCIVKEGTVRETRRGYKPKLIEEGRVFGSTPLTKGIVSQYTYTAATDVTIFFLTKEDFELILGYIPGPNTAMPEDRSNDRKTIRSESSSILTSKSTKMLDLQLDQLTTYKLLGKGSFGQVRLVQSNLDGQLFALKSLSKYDITEKKQRDNVINEYKIMRQMQTNEVNHPCIVGLHCALQDERYIYYVCDLLPGGTLADIWKKRRSFPEDMARFYAASVLLAFEQLHQHTKQIAFRDLKPENVVLNKEGYGVLVDFGLAKEVQGGPTYTMCGTHEYLAPEVLRGTGHDFAVDYWCLGIFIFELVHDKSPFYSGNKYLIHSKILSGIEHVKMPHYFSSGLKDLIMNLLVADQSKRMGRAKGISAIFNHRWFSGFDFEGLQNQTLQTPFSPDLPTDLRDLGRNEPIEMAPECNWWPDFQAIDMSL